MCLTMSFCPAVRLAPLSGWVRSGLTLVFSFFEMITNTSIYMYVIAKEDTAWCHSFLHRFDLSVSLVPVCVSQIPVRNLCWLTSLQWPYHSEALTSALCTQRRRFAEGKKYQ